MKVPARLLTTQRKEKRVFPCKFDAARMTPAQYVEKYLSLNRMARFVAFAGHA